MDSLDLVIVFIIASLIVAPEWLGRICRVAYTGFMIGWGQ